MTAPIPQSDGSAADDPSDGEHQTDTTRGYGFARWIAGQPGAVITVTTGVAALAGATVTTRYFRQFDVSPREVGYGTYDFVLASGLLLLWSVFLASVATGVGMGLVATVGSKGRDRATNLTLLLLLFVGAALVYERVSTDPSVLGDVTLLFMVGALAASEHAKGDLKPSDAVVLIAVGSIIGLISFVVLGTAEESANAAKTTGDPSALALSIGSSLGPVEVDGVDEALDGRCVLYLGAANGKSALWVPDLTTKDNKSDGYTIVVPDDTMTRRTGCAYQG